MLMNKIVNRELRLKQLLLNMDSSNQSSDRAKIREFDER